jgi:hypothetical protein
MEIAVTHLQMITIQQTRFKRSLYFMCVLVLSVFLCSRPRNGPPGPVDRPGPARRNFFLRPGGPHQCGPAGRAGPKFCRAARPEVRN